MSVTIGLLLSPTEVESCLYAISDRPDPTIQELIALENLYDHIDQPFSDRNKKVIFSDSLQLRIKTRLKYVIEYFTENVINKNKHLSYIFDVYFRNTEGERAYRNIWPTPSVLWTTHYPGLLEYTVNWIESYVDADVLTKTIAQLFAKIDNFDQYYIYLLFGLTRQSITNERQVIIDDLRPRTDLYEVNLPLPDLKLLQKKRWTKHTELNVLYIPTETIMQRKMQILTCQLNFQDETWVQKKVFLYNRDSDPSTAYKNEHIKNADVSRSLNQNKLVYVFPTFPTEDKKEVYKALKLYHYEIPIHYI